MNPQIVENIQNSDIIKIRYHTNLPTDFMDTVQSIIVEKINDYNSFTIHLDLKGLNITTLVRNKSWIENLMANISPTNYESFLKNVFIYNAPFIAKHIYSLISRHVRNIKEKIVFIPKEKKNNNSDNLQI